MKYFIFSTALLLAFVTQNSAQQLPKSDADIIQSLEHNISYLADDRLEGRLIGSRGEKMASEFLVENFQSLNILPKGEQGFIQAFKIKKITFKKASLQLETKTGNFAFDRINPSKNYPLPHSGIGEVSGKCIWVGYGIEAPSLNYNDYATIKSVKGKIVVIRLGRPDAENPHSALAAYASLDAKIDTALHKGADGIIILNTSNENLEPDFKPIVKGPFSNVPIFFLSSANKLDSIQFVNAKAKMEVDTTQIEIEGHNVVGYINNKSDKTVLIGAHYDHLGYNELGGSLYRKEQNEKPQIHNGADDNASGTAALIELAELLQKSPYRNQNYLFIAFSGEEEGLLGSKYYATHPTVPLKQINYMINMDMVGRYDTTKNIFSISGTGTSPRWDSILPGISVKNMKVKYDPSGTGASDHTSFYLEGVPVLHFFTGNHSDYHKPSDDWELLNLQGETDVIHYIYSLVGKLDKQPKLGFTKTKETQDTKSSFKVTLGIMPDYLFEGKGVKVDGVTEGRPAALAGILRGDVITKLGSIAIDGMESYMKALGSFEKGQQSTVQVLRANQTVDFQIKF